MQKPTFDFPADDPEHFEEGLVHLADMLELADPRRKQASVSRQTVKASGVEMPEKQTYAEWKKMCLDIVKELRALRPKVKKPDSQAILDAAVDRIEEIAG
ncbi:MAG: hypothetical protein FJ039_01970 [Chloroflexi bacterium]|nr:hypothetical protein [Chloroflexota bacterium]